MTLDKTLLISRIRGVGHGLTAETAQETAEEVGEAIHPVLGGILATVNAAKGARAGVEMSPAVTATLQNVGVQFNRSAGRMEFSQASR